MLCIAQDVDAIVTAGARDVAFPAIATGICEFPPDRAADIAVQTIRSTPAAVERVVLAAFDQQTRDILQAALNPRPTFREYRTSGRKDLGRFAYRGNFARV